MARLLLLPMALIILSLVFFLVIRLMTMLKLSQSKDIELTRSQSYGGDITELITNMLKSLNNLPSVQFESIVKINYKKIIFIKKFKPGPIQSLLKTGTLEIQPILNQNNISISFNKNKKVVDIPVENRWTLFWLGLSGVPDNLELFERTGLKVVTGKNGIYQQRNYIEIMVSSHLLPAVANRAFEICAPILSKAFGKNIVKPQITVRNFIMRILVNSLTGLPDYIEIKYNLFDGEKFVCDYLENSTLTY